MTFMRRNGIAAAVRMALTLGTAPSFHNLVDPTGQPAGQSLIFEDYCSVTIAAGVCEAQFGFIEHINSLNIADLVGIGFRTDTGTGKWVCFVNDCPTGVAPVTVRDTFTTAANYTDVHHLGILLDGPTKTIYWYIDKAIVHTFTPAASLDRMGAAANATGPQAMYSAVMAASADLTFRFGAGGFPQLRMGFTPET